MNNLLNHFFNPQENNLTLELRRRVRTALNKQGYKVEANGVFKLKSNDRESRRQAHYLSKAERAIEQERFLLDKFEIVKRFLVNGADLNIDKIDPVIKEVKEGTIEEILFRWWNVIWWSLPYEKAYGRQMRFVIWDQYHKAPIGLIGLQSPILKWSVRDKYLGISADERDFWVNQSLSAQRLGALPPYNDLLGGKLVALLLTSDVIRKKFRKKYKNKITLLRQRTLPANLLFVTTTGAYGKSSVYQRLKFNDEVIVKLIGFTQGTGTFHIPNELYESFIKYLKDKGFNVQRGYGAGPSKKLKLVDNALQALGFSNGVTHGIKRAVYLFPLVKNLEEVINQHKHPKWTKRSVKELTEFWKTRWSKPRVLRDKRYLSFDANTFLKETLETISQFRYIGQGK